MDDGDLGKINFEAYCVTVQGKTHKGKPIPKWEDLTPLIREGWNAGARASVEAHDGGFKHMGEKKESEK